MTPFQCFANATLHIDWLSHFLELFNSNARLIVLKFIKGENKYLIHERCLMLLPHLVSRYIYTMLETLDHIHCVAFPPASSTTPSGASPSTAAGSSSSLTGPTARPDRAARTNTISF